MWEVEQLLCLCSCKRFSQKILFSVSSVVAHQNSLHLLPSLLLFYSKLLIHQFNSVNPLGLFYWLILVPTGLTILYLDLKSNG